MKYLFFIFFPLLLFSCTSDKTVYWCGDHACINKKEKETYFKKTMIIEVKNLGKEDKKDISELEKIKKKAGLIDQNADEDNLSKQVRLDEEKMIDNEEELKEQASLEIEEFEKQSDVYKKNNDDDFHKKEESYNSLINVSEKCNHHIINARPNMQRKAKIAFKDCLRKEVLMTPELIAALRKENFSQKEIITSDKILTDEISSKEFNKLVEKIIKKNMSKHYPDINNIPN